MRTSFTSSLVFASAVAAFALGLGLLSLVGCPQPEEEEDPCAACTVTAQRN